MNQIKIALIGGEGRMGRLISTKIFENPQYSLVGSFTESSSEHLEMDIGSLIGLGDTGITLQNSLLFESWLQTNPVDVVVDFSTPESTSLNCSIAVRSKIPCVIGTTGLSQQTVTDLESLCVQQQCSCVIASNMLRGVNIFFHIAELIASYTKNWDVEIIETHHHNKVDSPSGTALTLGKRIAKVHGTDFASVVSFGREGKHLRKPNIAEIGIHSIRGGDIIGEHKVLFAGTGERIEFIHRAHNRDGFAEGTLTAVNFLFKHQYDGVIFSMEQVLNLQN